MSFYFNCCFIMSIVCDLINSFDLFPLHICNRLIYFDYILINSFDLFHLHICNRLISFD